MDYLIPVFIRKKIKLNLLKKWGWVFLMVMPGVIEAQRGINEASNEEKLMQIFHDLPMFDKSNNGVEKNISSYVEIQNYLQIDSIFTNEILLDSFVFFESIRLKKLNFKNDVYFEYNIFEDNLYLERCNFPKFLSIYKNKFDKDIYFRKDSIDDFGFHTNELKGDLSFDSCVFNDQIQMGGNRIDGNIKFKNCRFKRQIFLENYTVKEIIFQNCILPDTVYLKFLQFSDSRINFINCHSSDNSKYITMDVTGCDLNNIGMDYQNFKIVVNDSIKYYNETSRRLRSEEKQQIYLNLLENFKKKGQMESYKLLDLEYKEKFDHPTIHWIQTEWWNYGYDKILIFRNSGIFILLFTCLTMLFYKKLQSAYKIANADTNYGRIVNSFIYTNIVFWALRVDIARMKFRDHLAAASYIMLVYVTGIICLAYMVNYVIQS